MIGRTLTHYQIVERLGAGGMGEVYRARDQRLEREVALKLLPQGALGDGDARERFRREALALSRLNHPSIATLYDFDRDGETDFLVMELVQGPSLQARLSGGPLREDEILVIGEQIASALEAAHEQGVVHRDLKPANIVLTIRGHAKVLDFGVAKLAPSPHSSTVFSTGTATITGTPAYMAPEQLLGEEVGPRADVYAFGVVLYQLATGRLPFDGDQLVALANQVLHTPPPPPRRARPDLSPGLEELILRCLEKAPARRPSSAAEVATTLRLLREGGETRLMPPLEMAQAPGEIRSLAVLPFENLSGDPAQEFFADGMTDALISDLAQIGALRVISRTTAMQYKGARRTLPEIGRALHVDAIVEGSVARHGDRVRVTVQLIEAAADRTLWARSYERAVGSVLELQAEVARAVADEIRIKVSPKEAARLAEARPVMPAAYDRYVRGRFYWSKRNPAAMEQAIQEFRLAIDADPLYASAYSGLADCYSMIGAFRWKPSRDAFSRARAAARRALELDPDLGEAHCSLAVALEYYDWDWEGASRSYRRAIELNPGYATAHSWWSDLLVTLGRFDEAIAESKLARELDPLSGIIIASLGDCYYYARRYDEAIVHYREAMDFDPGFHVARFNLGRAYGQQGRHREAIAEFEAAVQAAGQDPAVSTALGYAYAAAGEIEKAEAIVARLEKLWWEERGAPYPIATIYAGMGRHDAAFQWLERAFEERDRMMGMLRVHPRLDPLRADARFDDLVRRVGIPG